MLLRFPPSPANPVAAPAPVPVPARPFPPQSSFYVAFWACLFAAFADSAQPCCPPDSSHSLGHGTAWGTAWPGRILHTHLHPAGPLGSAGAHLGGMAELPTISAGCRSVGTGRQRGPRCPPCPAHARMDDMSTLRIAKSPKTTSWSGLGSRVEDPELLVDMEIFVDTLRNMEPSEMRKAPKAPRQPRPSSLGRCAALPPIQEDRVAPRAPISLPKALRELLVRDPEERQEESPEEEIENPYLSPDERVLVGSHHGVPGDSTTSDGRAEGGSLPGMPRQAGAEEKVKLVAGGLADRSMLFRGNVLKGMALLSHFLEHRAAAADEGKPYSRLDNSVLYSRFVSPSTTLLELPGRDGRGMGSPTPEDQNRLGPADNPGPEMAMLEAPSPGSVPPVAEKPERAMALCPTDVLVSETRNAAPGEMLCPPGHAGRWWGRNPGASVSVPSARLVLPIREVMG
uniref:Uncharacterized protein n=1 Tax=Aquila chrysaetos chrysaetos TaxID=223781 RepID=A0A663EPC3_AQUCH